MLLLYFKAIPEKEDIEEILAYTVDGKSLNVSHYKTEIQKGLDDIVRVTSHEDLLKGKYRLGKWQNPHIHWIDLML